MLYAVLEILPGGSAHQERRHVLPWASTCSAYEIRADGVWRARVLEWLNASRSGDGLRFGRKVRQGLSSAKGDGGAAIGRPSGPALAA